MIPVDALMAFHGPVQDVARALSPVVPAIAAALSGLGAALHLLTTLAVSGIQATAEGAATAAGTTVDAAARADVVMSRLRFLSLAYTMVWVILAAYLVLLSLRQRRLERQIRRLRERLGA